MDKPLNIIVGDNNQRLPWLIIGILVIVIILMKQCNGVSKVGDLVCDYPPMQKVYIDTGRVVRISVPLPKDTITDTLIINKFITIPQEVDTQAIIEDYFRVYAYQDSFKANDVTVTVYDTIGTNRILSRRWEMNNYRPTLVKKDVVKLFVGMSLSSRHELPLRPDISPSLMLMTKKDLGVSISYSIFDRRVSAGVYYKIRLRK